MNANYNKGILLIELVISSALILLVFVSLFFLQSQLLRIKQDGISKTKATYYAEEAMEAIRYIREHDPDAWAAISIIPVSQDRWIQLSGNQWSFVSSSPGLLESTYDRRVRFEKVYRVADFDDPICGSAQGAGCNYDDPGSRRVIVQVTWAGGTAGVTLETIITDWQGLL